MDGECCLKRLIRYSEVLQMALVTTIRQASKSRLGDKIIRYFFLQLHVATLDSQPSAKMPDGHHPGVMDQ